MKKLLDLGKSFLKGFISILRIFMYLITIIFLLPATLITTIDKICSGEWNEVKLKYKFLKEAVKFIFNNIDNPILITNITELKSTKTVEGQTETNILSYVKVGPFGSKKKQLSTTKTKSKKSKVKNATPNIYDGIKFRSKLETYTYKKLKEANIFAEYESTHFELIPKFEYQGEKVRAMTYLPDFVGKDFIIECKGLMGDSFPLRWKIFKYTLMKNNSNYKLYLVRNQKQVDALIQQLKQEGHGN